MRSRFALVEESTSAELDLNGNIDLAVASTGDNTVRILLGDGDGTFTESTMFTVGASPVALVDATGRVVHPRLPRDDCGQPQRQVRDALAALRFREVKATRLYQEESQQSIDTGCGQMWNDLNDEMLTGRPAAARGSPNASACGWSETRGQRPAPATGSGASRSPP